MAGSRMPSDRYHRQERLIAGWDQDRINSTNAIIIGDGRLSDMILADLLSIGIGNLTRLGYSTFFEFDNINPEVRLEQVNEGISSYQQADVLMNGADMIIDATNSMRSKYYSANVALNNGMKYLSVSASNSSFTLFSPPPVKLGVSIDALIDALMSHHRKEYSDSNDGQGLINSVVCSAIATDEIRKRIFSLKDDVLMNNYTNSDIIESGTAFEGRKILQVGAGAIGTFTALALSCMNADLKIIDFDIIEETNLNRQFLFYGDIGKNKAVALAEKLSRYSPNITSCSDKIGQTFNPKLYGSYDAIFSCVDNNEARYYMNLAAKKYGIPLVNGGSSLFAGAAMPYFPGKTACLDCQGGGKLAEILERKENAKRAPGECFQPSLIISNQVVGALMINAYMKGLSNNFERSDYVSGQGIFNQNIEDTCLDYCMKRS